MSDDAYEECSTSPEITAQACVTINNLLQKKSKEKYEYTYEKFMDWKRKKNISSFSENVILVYFEHLGKTLKPSSLWATYSMLRSTLDIKENIDITKYSKLRAYLKQMSDGYKPKKSSTFSIEEIERFLEEAPDSKYLFSKVVLIIGVLGACRKQELKNMRVDHITDIGHEFYIKVPNMLTKTERSFIVSGNFYEICKRYMSLRPANADSSQFFLHYYDGKCTRQVVGINKLGDQPRTVATFLQLEHPEMYSGHCFRRSASKILVDGRGNLMSLKRNGGRRSQTEAKGYDNSMAAKGNNSNIPIVTSSKFLPNEEARPSSSRKDLTSSGPTEFLSNSIDIFRCESQNIQPVTLVEEDPLKLFSDLHGETRNEENQQQIQSRLEAEIYLLKTQVEHLKIENRRLKKTISFEDLDSEQLLWFYTGVQSKEMFLALYSLFEEKNLNYFKPKSRVTLSKKDQLLLTLMKLKLNLSDKDLAFRFNISCHSVLNIFMTWLVALHQILSQQLMRTRNENKTSFGFFRNFGLIIDSIEIKACNYKNMRRRAVTSDDYKQCNTFKGLVGVAPNAEVIFASKLVPPSTSDKTLSYGISRELLKGDFIMADKGFPISNVLREDVSVNSAKRNHERINKSIANVRINVERAVRRIKMYKILSMFPAQLIPYSSKVFLVCAVLTNFHSKINIDEY